MVHQVSIVGGGCPAETHKGTMGLLGVPGMVDTSSTGSHCLSCPHDAATLPTDLARTMMQCPLPGSPGARCQDA